MNRLVSRKATHLLAWLLLLASLAKSQSVDTGAWQVIGISPVVCLHLSLLPGNRLLCQERPHVAPYAPNPYTYSTQYQRVETTAEINLNGNQTSYFLHHINRNPFCNGAAQAADGSIAVVGGDIYQVQQKDGTFYIADGRKALRNFVPGCPNTANASTCTTGLWEDVGSMTTARWYPTVATLGDGSNIIVSGSTDNLDLTNWNNLTKLNPTYEFYPSRGAPQTLSILADTFPFNLYPLVFQLPSGRVWVFSGTKSAIITLATNAIDLTSIPILDPPTNRPHIYPFTPTALVLPMTIANNHEFRVMICGGVQRTSKASNLTTPAANELDPSDDCYQIVPEPTDGTAAVWTRVDKMPIGRVMPDVVLTPDGKAVYVNGAGYGFAGGAAGWGCSYNPRYQADVFDPLGPIGGRFSTLASATVDRMYHSTALLLPDGRVLTAGSEEQNWNDINTFGVSATDPTFANCTVGGATRRCTDPFEYRLEAFSPPYLFKGARPSITYAPLTVTYNSTFYVGVNDTTVSSFSFIRYTSVTHSTNTDQRFWELVIVSRNSTGVLLQAPFNPNVAAPGNWMLFAVANGIPSVSATVLLSNGPAVVGTIVPDTILPKANLYSGAGHSVRATADVAVMLALLIMAMVVSEVCIQLVAGGVAGAASRTVVSPLERTKILFQVQVTNGLSTSYSGITSTLRQIYNAEGLMGFFRGNGTNVIRMVPYSAIQFGTFEYLRKVLRRPGEKDLLTSQALIAGAISGTASVVATYPLDLIRTRLSVADAIFISNAKGNTTRPQRPTIMAMAKKIIRSEGGVLALYRGLVPTCMSIAPFVSVNFVSYHFLKENISLERSPLAKSIILLGCGALSGGFAQTVTHPFDVLRKRMQVTHMPGIPYKYTSTLDAISTMLRIEGPKSFYKGNRSVYDGIDESMVLTTSL
ncbi:hypothetical protein SmJEL517_g06219 [Synchytrium microbalum]|uniref:Galactose oxidase-like Early set domain-containing protein n=1 Tax=Synchytrium microbalum TaxID=1806994 RepID=A0A507BXZ1_9FUNG|nr:uncharacterized protein SmJEL517_g06219 [Synchytrium microbalum]TPX30153.1 hypothetical protein SmJEL517_g06219 [Synchytrium microbalum]